MSPHLSPRLAAGLLAAVGFVLAVLGHYPGMVLGDAESQFFQVVVGGFNDQHSPQMTCVWAVLNWLWPGPQGMLVLQAGLFFAGLFVLARSLQASVAPGNRGLWVFLLAASPTAILYQGFIMKDVQFAAAWFLALALFTRLALPSLPHRAGFRWGLWSLALILAAYGAAARHNAAPGLLPLTVFAAWVLGPLQGRALPRRQVLAVGFGLWMAIVGGIQLSTAMLGPTRFYPIHPILVHDLAGISARTNRDLVPVPFRNPGHYSLGEVRERYSPVDVDAMFFGHPPAPMRYYPDREAFDTLVTAWVAAVRAYPTIYLEQRWIITHAMAVDAFGGIDRYALNGWNGVLQKREEQARSASSLTQRFRAAVLNGVGTRLARAAQRSFAPWEGTWLHWMGGWLLGGTVALWTMDRLARGSVAARAPHSLRVWRLAMLAGFASGLLYLAPFPLVIPHPSPRYFYWSLLMAQLTVLVACLLTAYRSVPTAGTGDAGRSPEDA